MAEGYMAGMATGILLFLLTVFGMELFAYAAHRWVMHGPGWFLHASHHRPRTGPFEANDLYAVIFAVPSIILLLGGVQLGWGEGYAWVGAGIAAYGAIYFGFHDVVVHRRLAHRYVPRSAYMKRIVQAHRLHHAVETREGTVSFGFLWAPRPERLKAQLAGHAGLRAPPGGVAGDTPKKSMSNGIADPETLC
jgi:beta-carotene 3-hydroxylase